MKVEDGRVFVDLVHETSECFGNWSPTQSVKVGDYGVLNRKTAEFEKEGSIYDADFRPELQIGKNHPVLEGATEGQYIIVSRGCSAEAFDADFSEKHPEIVDSTIKGRWKITGKKGAIVVLVKPKEFRIQDKGRLLPHLSLFLKRKCLVTSVFTCPMFALFLTNNATAVDGHAALGLNFSNLGEDGNAWHHYSTAGVWKSGVATPDAPFYPLYTLYTPKPRSVWEWVASRR